MRMGTHAHSPEDPREPPRKPLVDTRIWEVSAPGPDVVLCQPGTAPRCSYLPKANRHCDFHAQKGATRWLWSVFVNHLRRLWTCVIPVSSGSVIRALRNLK